MADRIEPFTVTVPAETTIANFQRTDLAFRDGRVDRIQIIVPPGPSGLVGFRLAHSGQSIIPYTDERWFVVDDLRLDWDADNYPTGGAWELWAYNTDIYSHDLHVWFHVTELVVSEPATGVPLSIEPLGTAEDVGNEPEELA